MRYIYILLFLMSFSNLFAKSYQVFSVATQEYYKELNEWDDWTEYKPVNPSQCRVKFFDDGFMVEIVTEQNSLTFFGTSMNFDSKNNRWNIYKGIAKQNGVSIGNMEMHILDKKYIDYTSNNIVDGTISFFVDYSNTAFKEGGIFGMLMNGIDQFGLSVKLSIDEIEIEKINDPKFKALSFGSLGWIYFKNGYFDHSLALSKKALELDNSLAFVQFNIALIYLIAGDDSAIDQYLFAITLLNKNLVGDDRIRLLGEAIQDIVETDLNYGPLLNASEALELLRKQLQE